MCKAAAEQRLSRQGAAKWVRRYREQGLEGLKDRSSRPRRRVSPLRQSRSRGLRCCVASAGPEPYPPARTSCGLCSFFPRQLCGDDAGLLLVLEPVTFALDVDGGGVVQQPVEDGRGDDVVGEDRAPVAVALVGGQDDGPLLIPFRDQLKQASGGWWRRNRA